MDHTTDVRCGKLDLYAAWRFPEVWVEVPDVSDAVASGGADAGADRLPAGSATGRYRAAAASGALPGWTADAIRGRAQRADPVAGDRTRALEACRRHPGNASTARGPTTPRGSASNAPRAAGKSGRRCCAPSSRSAGWRAWIQSWRTADATALPLGVALEAVQGCRDAADLRARLTRPDGAAEPHDR